MLQVVRFAILGVLLRVLTIPCYARDISLENTARYRRDFSERNVSCHLLTVKVSYSWLFNNRN